MEMAQAPAKLGPARTIPAFYRLLLRGQLSRTRLVWLFILSGFVVLLGALTHQANGFDGPRRASVFALGEFGLSLYVPLISLLIATPLLGNLIEDRLLVYLWSKPAPRWHLAVASFAAAWTVALLVTIPTLALATLVSAERGMLAAVLVALLLGSAAYVAVFLFLGSRFSFGLWIGLVYVVVWENIVARFGDGPARISIRSYLASLLERATSVEMQLAGRSIEAAYAVPIVIAIVFLALTAWTLHVRDVD